MTSKITDVFSFDISDYNLSSFHQVYPEYTQICKNCVCYIVLGGLYVRSCSTIKLNSALPNLTFWYIKSKITFGYIKPQCQILDLIWIKIYFLSFTSSLIVPKQQNEFIKKVNKNWEREMNIHSFCNCIILEIGILCLSYFCSGSIKMKLL